jgi:cytochrome c
MDSFELNKIAGGVLGTLLFVMVLGLFSEAIFTRAEVAKPGYALPAQEAPAATAAAAPKAEPLPVLLAKADAKKGEANAKVCTTCHNLAKDGAPKATGPNLYGVVNRPVGSTSFGYSDAVKGHGGNWTYEALNEFITNPKGYISGTKMGYGGEKDAAKRADIIAYLRTLADAPAPLPAP